MRASFTFICISVPDTDERQALARGIIALLAQYPLGPPSSNWLGSFACDPLIGEIGLWNVNQIDSTPLQQAQLNRVEALLRG